MTPIKKYYFLKEHFLSDRYKYIALICLVFLLSSAQICKKCTILSNLRIITQEKRKLDKLRHFFHQLFELQLSAIFIFVFENCQNSFSWGPPFVHSGLQNNLNFGGVSCETRILSRWIQETYTLRKIKTRFYFFFRVENQISLISWSTFACSRMLFYIGLKLRF